MTNSTHRVEVVQVELRPHPSADRLEIVKVFDGYTCCVVKGQFTSGDLAAYIPPDSIVPETEAFAFLGDHRRIKVKRLRGIISMGLLMPAPEGSKVGDDVAEALGVTHYEPPLSLSMGGEAEKPPPGFRPVYDVESLRRYASAFIPSEPVTVSEKIHGCNARLAYVDGEFRCGSRTEWKRFDEGNLWWRALEGSVDVRDFLREHPEITVYAEVYGQVQDLRYGTAKGELRIAVFDLLRGADWIPAHEARELAPHLPWVPIVADGIPFDLESILALAEGPSLVPGANHVREGIVVKPLVERYDLGVGRVNMKVVGNGYLERA
jgi:RNA ligase (TIGR02306 family)